MGTAVSNDPGVFIFRVRQSSSLVNCLTLKMKAINFSETLSIIYQSKRVTSHKLWIYIKCINKVTSHNFVQFHLLP